jgi:membrane-associated phospholipid phosphatase
LLPVDYLLLIYNIVVAGSIVIFHQRISAWPLYLAFNLSLICLVWALCRIPRNPANVLMKIVRRWYFLIVLLFVYEETGGLAFIYFPHWLDNQLAALEVSIFGTHPNLALEQISFPPLNEFFMFGYLAYFFLILVYAMLLKIRRMHPELDLFATTACLTFLSGFLIFYFVPVAGPRFLFADVFASPLKGYLFVPLADFVIQHGAAEGGAMPSTHTAVALVILVHAWRNLRKAAWIFAPIVFGLVVGTFWGRFHYVSDTLAGVALAVLCLLISDKYIAPIIQKDYSQAQA